ncbi:MAG: phage tail protein [Anaerolineaceae bacterium]|nr:phage tail protein [Anaerolineaceae bacterium]
MSDPWLNFQYMIEFSDTSKDSKGLCNVLSISSQAVKRGTSSYYENPLKGGPIKHYVYGDTYTEPINISILLGEGARPWLKWFSNCQSGKSPEFRNITISLLKYGSSQDDPGSGIIWLRWDLINCFPSSWQLSGLEVSDSPAPMKIDMTLQFESMVINDGNNELHEVIG